MDTHISQLLRWSPVAGRTVLDVGCGSGAFLKDLHAEGAMPIGIEIDERTASAAREQVGGRAEVLIGRAEALPLADGTIDTVCFIFSYHHIPSDLHGAAFAEAIRVARPGGRIHVVDPLHFGDLTSVIRPVEDETEVRLAAQRFLSTLPERQVRRLGISVYEIARSFPDVDALLHMVTHVDPARAERARDPATAREVADLFDRFAVRAESGCVLRQPCASFHFEKN